MTSRALGRNGLVAISRAIAAMLLIASFSVEASTEELASTSYRLRGGLAATSAPLIGQPDSLIRAVGGTLASDPGVGVSVGDESGIVLVGGLWPALVGAAFDQDRDLVPNVTDNCTVLRNTVQLDADLDGYGNACDADITGDLIVNFADLALLKRAFFTEDPVADLNGDGIVNFADLAIMKQSFFKKPGPGAGKP